MFKTKLIVVMFFCVRDDTSKAILGRFTARMRPSRSSNSEVTPVGDRDGVFCSWDDCCSIDCPVKFVVDDGSVKLGVHFL